MSPSNPSIGIRCLIAVAPLAFLGLGSCVVAAPDPGGESRTVRFSDLNVSDPSGAHELYLRIRGAAQVVCSYYFLPTDTDKARCVRDATADAVARIKQPELSGVFNANYKPSAPSR